MTIDLNKLRKPFEPHQIGKLPKPTKKQTQIVNDDFKKGARCQECGGWHHPNVVHLDYVGHAALTDRLLDCDLGWNWEPVAITETGIPLFDNQGGLWIKLTVGSVTRLGYGNAPSKANADPGAREKEVIGDALRNAAMRFGGALELWHKGDLHIDTKEAEPKAEDNLNVQELGNLDRLLSETDTDLNIMMQALNIPRVDKNNYNRVITALENKLNKMQVPVKEGE